MSEESIKVGVRVRPFNKREKDRKAQLIINMEGPVTTITDLEATFDAQKSFAYDYSYWSHDGFTEESNGFLIPDSPTSKYASQSKVFDDLGSAVLENAFSGFNCTLFAYGQTGSGKSYSMVGYGSNKGIVPVTCEMIFSRIGQVTDKFEVTFSMLEIYNEQVNDLLAKKNLPGGLQVRQHPSQGFFYAQDLSKIPVGSYKEIEHEIEKGTAKRSVASTMMNATSSRAHTVVTVTFDQIFKAADGSETKKSSVINLVDLAGSERADSTGATGDRLKEGANINKSLSALGNVISALAELSTNPKKKGIMVPYRDSVLTKLLQNALGGNSKTIMIAALSPADINYQETLSTLRYADRAKRIKTKATVNENQVDKLIRELKEENERLKNQLESGNGVIMERVVEANIGATEEEMDLIRAEILEELKAQMSMNAQIIQENTSTFKERLEKAQKESEIEEEKSKERKKKKNKDPYLTNLNEDPILSYVICYFLGDKETIIGSSFECQIQLSGLNICPEHAKIINDGNRLILIPETGAKLKVNGQPVAQDEVELQHNDRVLFGSSHLYVFINPSHPDSGEQKITYDMAQKELAATKGLYRQNTTMTEGQQIVEEEIIKVLPIITDLNAISEELNKYRVFEVVLIPMAVFSDRPSLQKDSTVMIKVTNLQTMNMWLWDIGKLQNRRYMIQDLYQKYLEGDDCLIRNLLRKEDDPFWDSVEDLFIGMGRFFMHSLSYRMDFEDKAFISDYGGKEIGTLVFRVTPCDAVGDTLGEAYYVDGPETLMGEKFYFKLEILDLEINSYLKGKGFLVKFKLFGEKYRLETPIVEISHNMNFNYSKIVCFESIKNEHLVFFDNGCITFFLYSVQKERSVPNSLLSMSTRELKLFRDEEKANPKMETVEFLDTSTTKFYDMDPAQTKLELSLLQNKYDILKERDMALKNLCSTQIKNPKNTKDLSLFLSDVMKILNSKPKK